MFGKQDPEVLVVGAGPVGMFAALRLAQRGIRVQVVDSQRRSAARSYALALHSGSLGLLADAELADELVRRGHRVGRIGFYDRTERHGALSLATLGGPYPFLLVLSQQILEEVLETRLAAAGVEVKWNHRLAGLTAGERSARATVDELRKDSIGYAVAGGGWVVVKTRAVGARFVIGADGHRSAVRRALEVDFDEVGPRQLYGVFELAASAPAPEEVRVVLGEKTTDVLWPLGNGRSRWSFELPDDWEMVPRTRAKSRLAVQLAGDAYPYLDEGRLARLLRERAPWFEGAIGEVGWSVAVRFERRLAERFGRDVAWLAGDAAHLASPIGVQSMNAGFFEAEELTRRMHHILRHGGGLESLERYGRARQAEWRLLQGLDPALVATADASPWTRTHAQRLLGCIPAVGSDLVRLLPQLGLEPSPAAGRALSPDSDTVTYDVA